jgi:hypothetical protein
LCSVAFHRSNNGSTGSCASTYIWRIIRAFEAKRNQYSKLVVELIQEIGFKIMQQFGVMVSAKPPLSSQKLNVSAAPAAVLNSSPQALASQVTRRNQ